MEAAAKTVELLTQRLLPDKPHHLSVSPDWRHRRPTTESRPFEEWNSPRLQYMTFLSEADRGPLLTRPYYDMREEPPKPVPREVNALGAKAGAEKKKLSLSDYKNKKTTGAVASPPEPSMSKGRDSSHSTPSHLAQGTTAGPRPSSEARPLHEARAMEPSRSRDSDSSGESRRHQNNHVPDRSIIQKPLVKNSSLPPKPPSPIGKRRVSGLDDETRPSKRNRADDDRYLEEGGRHREDTQSRKEHDRRDTSSHRDSPLPNGKGMARSNSNRGTSPGSRPRGESVNGTRQSLSGSNRGTPTKQLTPSKSSVPPLLSPLRLGFEGGDDGAGKSGKKRRDPSPEKSPRPRKPEPHSDVRKPKTKLPPLLSPTLPPIVEAALQRQKKDPEEFDDGEPKKHKPVYDYTDDEQPMKKERRRFMVHLKVRKAQRADFRRLLALAPRDSGNPARKRPLGHSDSGAEPVAMKKSRSSDMHNTSRGLGPSTPPRKGATTAMSRVNSNSSVAQTPGDSAAHHPTPSGMSDKRTNGQDANTANILKEREGRMSQLGRRLKHDADVAFRGQPTPNSGRSAEASPEKGYVLGLESILAFMLGFQALGQLRTISNKPCDPSAWKSLLPYMDYLKREIGRNPQNRSKYLPLSAMLALFYAMAAEEGVKCYLTLENSTPFPTTDLIKLERLRSRSWAQVKEEAAGIDSDRLKAEVHPWTTLDEVAASAIRVLRRWAADEDLEWSPEINSRDYSRH